MTRTTRINPSPADLCGAGRVLSINRYPTERRSAARIVRKRKEAKGVSSRGRIALLAVALSLTGCRGAQTAATRFGPVEPADAPAFRTMPSSPSAPVVRAVSLETSEPDAPPSGDSFAAARELSVELVVAT